MTSPSDTTPVRSYGCTFGCGAPFDIIITSVMDSDTQLLCVPCFLKLAGDMIRAMLSESDPQVQEALALAIMARGEQAPGPTGNKRGKNAPATTEDPDLIASFDDLVTVDELPDEMR